MRAGDYDRRVRVYFFFVTGKDSSGLGTDVGEWRTLKTIWAKVRDELPSRNETIALNLPVARNLTRVRYRYDDRITTAHRMELLGKGGKMMQIIGGPGEVASSGRYREQEVMCETIT